MCLCAVSLSRPFGPAPRWSGSASQPAIQAGSEAPPRSMSPDVAHTSLTSGDTTASISPSIPMNLPDQLCPGKPRSDDTSPYDNVKTSPWAEGPLEASLSVLVPYEFHTSYANSVVWHSIFFFFASLACRLFKRVRTRYNSFPLAVLDWCLRYISAASCQQLCHHQQADLCTSVTIIAPAGTDIPGLLLGKDLVEL